MNWFLVSWCKFRKAKSYFTDFRVSFLKKGHGHLLKETLESAEWAYELSWFFAWWLWCNNLWLDKHYTQYLWLSNARLLQSTVLNRPAAVAGRILWSKVCPSFPPAICLGVFLELDHWIYLNFDMVLEILMKMCMTTQFLKTFFAPEIWSLIFIEFVI